MSQESLDSPLAQLREAAVAAERDGVVARHAIGVDPKRWETYASREVAALIEGSSAWDPASRTISRQALRNLAERVRQSEGADRVELARELLWASLAWGHGKTYRLARRRAQELLKRPEGFALEIFERAQDETDVETLFDDLRVGGDLRVKYWGPNFFTKFLYFSAPHTSPAAHLIVDAKVRGTLAALGEDESARIHAEAGGFGSRTYLASVAIMNRLAEEWGVAPDAVEYAAFNAG